MPKVTITVAGHEVEVDSAEDPLAIVAATALDLFDVTKDPAMTRGFSAVGFTGELAGTDVDVEAKK